MRKEYIPKVCLDPNTIKQMDKNINYTISVLFGSKCQILPISKEVENEFKQVIKKVHIDKEGYLGSIYIRFQDYT